MIAMWNSFVRKVGSVGTRRGVSQASVITRWHAVGAMFLAVGLVLTLAIGLPMLGQGVAEGRDPRWTSQVVSADQPLYRINATGQLMRSDDNGRNWASVGGLRSRATALAVAGGVLYVGTESAGLFKSADDGATWQSTSQDLGPMPNVTITAVAADPANADRVVAATGYWFGTSEAHFAPMDIFYSEDGGAAWYSISRGSTGEIVERLGFDAMNPHVVKAHLSDGTVLVLSR